MSNWILYGFKKCGKTYFGRRLAEKLGLSFLDIDQLIEKKKGLSCREIVLQFGESYFRQLETETILSLQCTSTIISVGGGTVLSPNNLDFLKRLGSLIYLICPKEILKKRLLTPPLPSYFDINHPEESFEKMYTSRIKQYEIIPAHRIDLSKQSDSQILEKLCRLINLEISSASPHGGNLMEKPLV